ncbi:MAG: PQQ-binding-like beta-propeller repeat protein, partial [Alicyclobacillus sp.]|nr:PQQ-binding-like beta-propeller repeat protein [Alicyclobacillus sp.]
MKRAVRWLSVFASASVMFGAAAAPAWAGTAGTAGTSGNGDFPTFGYDYQQTRHVPYTSINRNNVANLGLVWDADLMKLDSGVPGGSENFPIEVNGVLYVTTSFDHVFAFNAATGKLLWHWKPANIGAFKNFGLNVNRGVAYGDGKLFLLTLDMHLVSIDAKTGKTVKNILLSDVVPGATTANGYYETTAPIYYKGNVYVGSSGGDNGIRGFFMAFKASDLSPAWSQPFWTIPPKGQGWLKGGKFQGGGAVWMPAAIDPDTGILYFGVGNPAPDFYGKDRPGANLYTDSVVALDAKTGKLIWARQEVSHDLWDYDAAASPMVLTATVHGKKEKVVVEGGKDGQWYAWDAKTGKVIYNGVPFVTIRHPAPTPKGVLEYPGALGGENYAPETYDPGSNYVLIPGIEDPMLIIAAKNDADVAKNNQTPGAVDFGTTIGNAPNNITPSGTITAIDLNTGKKVYQVRTDTPMRGGFTSTASGIAFYGDGYGYLNAMEIKTGKILWSFQTGAPIGSAPAIYQIGGREYVAVSVGGAPTGNNSNASK